MSSWRDRVRLESSVLETGGGQRRYGRFVLTATFDSKEEFERAEGFMESLVTAGMKPEILDSLKDELEQKEQMVKEALRQLELARLANQELTKTVEHYEACLAPLQELAGIKVE